MKNIKAIAYDLEGTVINIENIHHQAHILAAKEFNVELTIENCINSLPYFIGGPDELVAKEISKLTKEKINWEKILTSKRKHYEKLLDHSQIKLRKGFLEFFESAKKLGLKQTIGSLTSKKQALVLLEKTGLINLFGKENIVLREDVINLKPAPDIWIETAKRALVNPEEQLIFEDSIHGIEAAYKVNAYPIGMPVYDNAEIILKLEKFGAKKVFLSWEDIELEKIIPTIKNNN